MYFDKTVCSALSHYRGIKKITFETSRIYFRKKEIDRGIVLKGFSTMWELKKSPVFLTATKSYAYISKVNKKSNGLCYIPVSELDHNEVYFLNVNGDIFKLLLFRPESPEEIAGNYVTFLISVSNKEGFKKALKKYKKGR
jgi:hypothetical protein